MYPKENFENKETRQFVKELVSLKEEEIIKIERVSKSLEEMFAAEAEKEAHKKIRILFERAAREWLPFILYCLAFAPVAGFAIPKIVSVNDWTNNWPLIITSWLGLIIVMLIPVVFVPRLHNKIKNEI